MYTRLTHQDPASSTKIGSVGNSTWIPIRSATGRNATRLCLKPWTTGSTQSRSERPIDISLTRELEQFLAEKVATGRYQNASEVIREGLRILEELDQRLASL